MRVCPFAHRGVQTIPIVPFLGQRKKLDCARMVYSKLFCVRSAVSCGETPRQILKAFETLAYPAPIWNANARLVEQFVRALQ